MYYANAKLEQMFSIRIQIIENVYYGKDNIFIGLLFHTKKYQRTYYVSTVLYLLQNNLAAEEFTVEFTTDGLQMDCRWTIVLYKIS